MDQPKQNRSNFDPDEVGRPSPSYTGHTLPMSLPSDVSPVEYVAFRRRLFAEDVKGLTSLILLVQHKPESSWGEPRDVEQDNVEALAYVMARNLLAERFFRRGVPTPLLGTCLRVDGCEVTIIDKAALVFIDSVDCSVRCEKVKAIVNSLLANNNLPEDLKELVHYCYLSEQITVLTPEKTCEAFDRSKEKSAAIADVLWPGLLPDTPAFFAEMKYEAWIGIGGHPIQASHLREKSSQYHQPHASLNVHWEKLPQKPDMDDIFQSKKMWLGRLFKKNECYELVSVEKSDAQGYVNFRRSIFLYEAKDLIALSHIGCDHNVVSEKSSRDISIREAYAFLRARRIVQRTFVRYGEYVPPLGEFVSIKDHDVFILNEARIVIIDSVGWKDVETTIENVLKHISESDSISDESKALFTDEARSTSCSVFILTSDEDDETEKIINRQNKTIFGEWNLFSDIYIIQKSHYCEFYKIASNYTTQTCLGAGNRSWKVIVLSIHVADYVYDTLMEYLRDPLCSHHPPKDNRNQSCATDPSDTSLFVIFPRDWVETDEKSRFDVDCATNRLKIRISLVRFKEIIENLLRFEASNVSMFVGLEQEIRPYCINILNAFFKPEMALIKQYEKITGLSILTSCLNVVVGRVFSFIEEYFSSFDPPWRTLLAQELKQALDERTFFDTLHGAGPRSIAPIDFEKEYSATLEIGTWHKGHPQPYSDDVYRQADSATRSCHYRFDSHNEYEKQESIAETNALITFLRSEFIHPFSQISRLHERIVDHAMDMDKNLIAEVETVFNRIQNLSPTVDESELSAYRQSEREEFWKRTLNILISQCKPLLNDLTIFFQKRYTISSVEAVARLCGCPKRCIADSLALLAVDRLRKGTLTCN